MLYFKKEIIAIALIGALEVALAENRELVSVWPNLLPPNHLSFCARSTMWTGLTIARPFRSLFFPRSNKRTTVGECVCIILLPMTTAGLLFTIQIYSWQWHIRFIPSFPMFQYFLPVTMAGWLFTIPIYCWQLHVRFIPSFSVFQQTNKVCEYVSAFGYRL